MSEEIQRLLEVVPGATHAEMITYETASEILGISLSRLYSLINAGELHSIKVPHDSHKRLRSDEVEWFKAKREGNNVGRSPYIIAIESLAKATLPQPRPLDTWDELRRYVEQHLAGSDVADQLTSVIAAVAQHIANSLVRDALGVEPLAAEDRARLSALLAALTQKGGETG